MGAGEAIGLFKDFGLPGLFIAFLIWDKMRLDAKWRRIEEARLAQQKDLEEKRQKIDQDRIDTDKDMVLVLQALCFRMVGREKP